jgi:PAS domain S-box-containing protein
MADRIAVPSADFIRNIGYWQGEALRNPISITHHGRDRLVLATPEAFHADDASGPAASRALTDARGDQAALLENFGDGYLAFDARLRITASNAIVGAFTGRAIEDLHGAALLDVMPQPLASILQERSGRVLRARKPEGFEASTFDGRRIEARVFPLAEGGGVLFRNTTEVFMLRRRLEVAQAIDAALHLHSRAASIRLDVRARIEAVDEVFCRWSGFRADDVVGHRFLDLISPPQRRGTGELIERVMRDGVTRETPLTLVAKRGAEMPGTLTLAPILADCIAHGAQAIWSPGEDETENQCAA